MCVAMTEKLELKTAEAATAVMIPNEMLLRLQVKSGDQLFLVETPEGLLLSPRNPQVALQVQYGREGMREFRETFERLAR